MGHDRLTFLQREAEYDDEEDEYDKEPWRQSGRDCDCCGEGLPYCEEVFVLEVMEAAGEGGQIFHDVLLDEDGDHRYRPYMMHLQCWEAVLEHIDEATADQPPMEAEGGILKCSRCASTIGNFEPFVGATFGEISVSERSPSGLPSAAFTPMGRLTPVCLSCIVHVIDDHLDDWEELVELYPGMEDSEGEQDE